MENLNGYSTKKTPVQQFYTGQSIFITGGSGFLGKILIQKLLRSCIDITTIYILIRPKRENNIEDRLNNIFGNVVFDQLKVEVPNFRSKIVPIKGDFSVDKLGLSDYDENLLRQNVSIVFHVGATVRFTEDIKIATTINTSSTDYLLHMAKNMKKLKAFIYVSTAYANSHLKHIEEYFYTYPIDYQTLRTLTRDLKSEEVSKKIVEHFPEYMNTYVFTKAMAESLIRDTSEELPIGVFRPAIVVSPAEEPLIGWTDNYFGPVGLIAYYFKGITKYLWIDSKCTANLVPVDKTINALIVSAWDVFNKSKRRSEGTLIYNYVSSNDAPLTWGKYFDTAQKISEKYQLKHSSRTITLINNNILFNFCSRLAHTLSVTLFNGTNDVDKQRIRRIYNKFHHTMNTIGYWGVNEWTYTNDNVHAMWYNLDKRDKRLFNFDMQGFNWPNYLDGHCKGILTYLFKEDLNILEVKNRAKI
ncbi:putative fatty acyl-CoA reductase CG5065 isoform X1 [Harpegnathos saltator]|nr:putative fatty acyl-CoA reductase CG5065 isoform X1 [Harpegnathos saltator]XP_025160243.1 putative fatty acyl-CoA reductase CG5065 isoform X1 [Harpegnathos saltator]